MSFQHNLIISGVSLHPCSTVLVLKNSECYTRLDIHGNFKKLFEM